MTTATSSLSSISAVPTAEKISDERIASRWQKLAEKLIAQQRNEFCQAFSQKGRYLDWKQRTLEIQTKVTSDFDALKKYDHSMWGVNGDDEYNLITIRDHLLAERIIRDAPPTQKDFYFLDIGAGDFQWGDALAKYLNSLKDIRKDATFHIISVGGESYNGEKLRESGQCKIYNLGGFKVEELEAEFPKVGLNLKNRVDLAVSRLCFTHLVDPVGTLAQTFNLLRPGSGILLSQNFKYYLQDSDTPKECIVPILEDLRAPYLMWRIPATVEEYLIKKPNDRPARIPMRYLEVFKGSVRFARETLKRDLRKIAPESYFSLQGNQGLYEWLKANALLKGGKNPHKDWAPIFDTEPTTSSLASSDASLASAKS